MLPRPQQAVWSASLLGGRAGFGRTSTVAYMPGSRNTKTAVGEKLAAEFRARPPVVVVFSPIAQRVTIAAAVISILPPERPDAHEARQNQPSGNYG